MRRAQWLSDEWCRLNRRQSKWVVQEIQPILLPLREGIRGSR